MVTSEFLISTPSQIEWSHPSGFSSKITQFLSAGQDLDDLDLDLSQRSWVQQESEFDHQRWDSNQFFFGNRNGWIWVWGCLKMAKWSAHLWPYYAILIYIRTGNEVPKHEVASLFSDNPTYHRYHLHGYLCPDVVEDHFSIWGSPLPNKMGLGPLRASHPTRWTEWLGLKAQIFWHTHTHLFSVVSYTRSISYSRPYLIWSPRNSPWLLVWESPAKLILVNVPHQYPHQYPVTHHSSRNPWVSRLETNYFHTGATRATRLCPGVAGI